MRMSELPINPQQLPPTWALTTLGTLVDYGKTEKVEPYEIAPHAWVLELEDIEKNSSRIFQRVTQAERQSKSTKNRFELGDVLYGKLRPYLNKVVLADQPGFCTTEIVPLRTSAELDARYLFYWLKHPAFLKHVEAESHGMNMPRLGTDAGKAAPLVLAPRAEQTRIADQLETLLARIQACQDRLDAIPALLKRFRQTVLTAAVTGKLTADWREDHAHLAVASALAAQLNEVHRVAGGHKTGNAAPPTEGAHSLTAAMFPWQWSLLPLRELVAPDRPITYGILKPGPELEQGVPYVRVADFPNDQLKLEGIRMTSPEIDSAFKRSRLLPGDLLLSIRGTVGRLVRVPEALRGANITQDTARLSLQPLVNATYVEWALRSELLKSRMNAAIKGVAVRGINIGDVRALQIPLPSRHEQDEIARRIEQLMRVSDALQARLSSARSKSKTLVPAILSKAFRGELVEQDPRDEPATELLARLAESRDAQPRPARGRKRGAGAQPSTSQPNDVPDWLALPDGAWACPPDPEGLRASVLLTAVLRAWGGREAPQAQARLAYLLCEQPRLLSAVLPEALAQQWQRLVGDEARPVSAEVSVLQPAVNIAWRRAVIGMRARGDLLEVGAGADAKWALGAGADVIETKGWPQGRAGFVVGYLRAHGIESVLPTLEPAQREFVDARAA